MTIQYRILDAKSGLKSNSELVRIFLKEHMSMFEFDNPTEKPVIRKTVDDIISKLTEILEDLHAVQKNSEEDIKNAENAIFTWQENKVYSESEVLRAKSISEKLKALLS